VLLSIRGKKIEAQHIGRSGGLTLVFLHEGLGSSGLWRDFPQRVAQATGLPAFVYSRAGYGQSDRAPMPRPVRYMHDEAQLNSVALGCGLSLGELIQDEEQKKLLITVHQDPNPQQRVCVAKWARRNGLKAVFVNMQFPEG